MSGGSRSFDTSWGRWNMQVDILITDFEKLTLTEQVEIRGR